MVPPPHIFQRLITLADNFYAVACDVLAMGPPCHEAPVTGTGTTVAELLDAVGSSIDALAADCRRLRTEHVQRQLAARGMNGNLHGLKLHVGAGKHPLESWINIDRHPAELAMDVRWGLPFPDGSVRYVFMSHVLEHFYYPYEALRVLQDIHRVLEPGGIVRIVVPDIEKCLRTYVEPDPDFVAARTKTWDWWPTDATRLEGFLGYAGATASPSALLVSHKFGYDFETLHKLLRNAGFDAIARSDYLTSTHPELLVDDRSEVAHATFRDEHYSLFVEAVR